jgi:hypothetical protein
MVYVDGLVPQPYARNACFRAGACHMIADTREELHLFAARVGLRRSWFQDVPKSSIPHYDLTAKRRARAVLLGAVELERRPFVEKFRALRAVGFP